MPYFKDIYKDLSARSDKPTKGINRLVFIEVSTLYYKKLIAFYVQFRATATFL